MQEVIHSYKNLIVWQKSIELVTIIYELTDEFSREEIFGLTSQIRRAAISIPSNIAEGRNRGTRADYTHFLRMSYGSGAELETQIEISKKLLKTKTLNYNKVDGSLNEVMKMLNVMINKLQAKKLTS